MTRARPGEAVATFARLLTIETDDCVLWPFATNSKGYGCIGVNGRITSVHVLACEHHHGPRPEGRQAAHHCGVNLCVNGRHIRWATPRENEIDKKLHKPDWLAWRDAERAKAGLPPVVDVYTVGLRHRQSVSAA